MSIVYLNGEFLPRERACVPVMDRGFLFGDGVYEVIPAYGGHLFRLEPHLRRLDDSLNAIRLANPLDHAGWREVLEALLRRNGGDDDQSVYLQVTRGAAPDRDHRFPEPTVPTVFAMTSPIAPAPPALRESGVAAVTVEDIRWRHCHIKAITLLPNVLLRQQAVAAGAQEAVLIRDGHAVEGAASNLFVVHRGVLLTPPKGPDLLPGITRDLVLELAGRHGVPAREAPLPAHMLRAAEEVWLTSSTREIVPVTRLDDAPVGDGRPGPVFRRMSGLYRDYKAAVRRGAAG